MKAMCTAKEEQFKFCSCARRGHLGIKLHLSPERSISSILHIAHEPRRGRLEPLCLRIVHLWQRVPPPSMTHPTFDINLTRRNSSWHMRIRGMRQHIMSAISGLSRNKTVLHSPYVLEPSTVRCKHPRQCCTRPVQDGRGSDLYSGGVEGGGHLGGLAGAHGNLALLWRSVGYEPHHGVHASCCGRILQHVLHQANPVSPPWLAMELGKQAHLPMLQTATGWCNLQR